MFQITINLSDQEEIILEELANSQMRTPSKQAHWMLRRLLLQQKIETQNENCDDFYEVGNN